MNANKRQDSRKIIALTALGVVFSIFSTLIGAPFVRVLATTKSRVFWFVGVVLTAALFFLKLSTIAIYVGAIWMTLGLYSELEKQGLNWKKSSSYSVLAGMLFGALSYFAIIKWSPEQALAEKLTEGFVQAFKQYQVEETMDAKAMLFYMPGMLGAALIATLAAAFAFETTIFQVFRLKREKLASALKWLEFRLPDAFVWVSLFSFLFSMVETPIKHLQTVALNMTVISVVAYCIQGMVVTEFAMRIYRVGKVTKFLVYLLLFTPVSILAMFLVGIGDYWLDLRRRLRKRVKLS